MPPGRTVRWRGLTTASLRVAADQYDEDARHAYSSIADPVEMNRAAEAFIQQARDARELADAFDEGTEQAYLVDS